MRNRELRELLSGELSSEAKIRVLGREAYLAAASLDRERMLDLGPEIGSLTAGADPDRIDTESPEYKAGAQKVLEVVSNALFETRQIN